MFKSLKKKIAQESRSLAVSANVSDDAGEAGVTLDEGIVRASQESKLRVEETRREEAEPVELNISETDSPASEDLPPDMTVDTITPRRKNLAAKLLLYGEEISGKNTEILSLRAQLEKTEQRLVELSQEHETVRRQLHSAHMALESVKPEIENRDKKLDQLVSSSETLSSQHQEQIRKHQDTIHKLSAENSQLRHSLETVNTSSTSLPTPSHLERSFTASHQSEVADELPQLHEELQRVQAELKSRNDAAMEQAGRVEDLEKRLVVQKSEHETEIISLSTEHSREMKELENRLHTINSRLETERKSNDSYKADVDRLREELLDKQLDEDKQLSQLQASVNQYKAEIRSLQTEAELNLVKSNQLASQQEEKTRSLEDRLSEANHRINQLSDESAKLAADLRDKGEALEVIQSRFMMLEQERDDLLLRNANLSSQIESDRVLAKQVESDEIEESDYKQERIAELELNEASQRERLAALEVKLELLGEELRRSQAELELRLKIEEVNHTLESQLLQKTQSLKLQQQTIQDLKKTIKRELRGQGRTDTGTALSGHTERGHTGGHADGGLNRVNSVPVRLARLQQVSPAVSSEDDDVTPQPNQFQSTQTKSDHDKPAGVGAAGAAGFGSINLPTRPESGYRHEINGLCGHKDINFEYLKNVVFGFLVARDSRSLHLVKPISVLLEFSPHEEQLLKETLEWRQTWWPSNPPKPSKKPSNRF